MKRIVVLISGQGSNLQALIDACQTGGIPGRIVAVFSNRADAYGLTRARQAGIAAHALAAADYAERQAFDAALADRIATYQPDLVVLAGYMRILSPVVVQRFCGRILNIHPSLLPRYPGLDTHRRALAAGEREHGTSVHFVNETLDGGPLVLQARVPIFSDDNVEEIAARVQRQEHAIYPLAVAWFCQGRLRYHAQQAWLDGQPLPPQGYIDDSPLL
ncbi:phosphoribosylglycinamide formyltransferase [Edwardsiella hoshinae]|uniref:Phosphoribosylglycinamide formyltransferase n=1 Tax=Edwardsiella hoshinae TaxID=93378 RepID=A0ABM6EK86_9GAMM|nr:phosphoribosylglycinamide formyltransferase [Edwardsiella hoshinae]AOV97479.1 phosphoribosylglycinamide formyltransferase [Edwardsiella hoshinae]